MPNARSRPAPSAPARGFSAAALGRWRLRPNLGHVVAWLAAGLLLGLLGGAAIVRWDIAQRREAFAADARIAHRLLSQRAAQLEAVLATLALVAPASGGDEPAARLPALWPAVLAVQRSDADHPWTDAVLAAAEAQSRAQAGSARHAVLAGLDAARGQYWLVLAGHPASWALRVNARRLVQAEEWPLSDSGPVRVWLAQGDEVLLLHAGEPQTARPAGLTPGFTFAKVLATPGQPFELHLQRATGPAQWPWAWLLAWAAACAAATTMFWALQRARSAQRRQAELMRLAQAARLNTLGELAAGLAHELNQPLAAVLASTRAAQRLLPPLGDAARREGVGEVDDDSGEGGEGLDGPALRQALGLAADQARRASDVLSRLRRLVQDPTRGAVLQAVDLHALCSQMLHLLGPELQRRGVTASVSGQVGALHADPVMLEQIVHNLVTNALQALEQAGTPAPRIELRLQPAADPTQAQLRVCDNGPGLAPEHLERVFEPFFTTRADGGGLGLGLPLCQTLAQTLGGSLEARNAVAPGGGVAGAEMVLTLPLVSVASAVAPGAEAESGSKGWFP